jgi:hypothetical protein
MSVQPWPDEWQVRPEWVEQILVALAQLRDGEGKVMWLDAPAQTRVLYATVAAVMELARAGAGIVGALARRQTLTTRISPERFWALPIGWGDGVETFGLAIQKEEGMPIYLDVHGEAWVLQVAPDGTLYRIELV